MSKLKTYWLALPTNERDRFARSCCHSAGHINNVAHGQKPVSDRLAIYLEKASSGAIPIKETNPEFAKLLLSAGYVRKVQK